jgi:hypothetical protein
MVSGAFGALLLLSGAGVGPEAAGGWTWGEVAGELDAGGAA